MTDDAGRQASAGWLVETRQAHYFVAVGEELHFGRAAQRLNISQPPLSQAIRQLERQLGARLLERSTRSVELTPAGETFLQHCQQLLAAAENARQAVLDAQSGSSGRLAIGAVTSAFTGVLPPILTRLRESLPGVDLTIREVDTQEGVQALLQRRLDVAVIRYHKTDESLQSTPLHRDQLVVALPANHRLMDSEGPVDTADLADEPWVWIPREVSPNYHDKVVSACQDAGFSPRTPHSANSIHSQLVLIGCGLGVALVPASSARPEAGVGYRPLLRSVELVELSIVRRLTPALPLAEKFLQYALGTSI